MRKFFVGMALVFVGSGLWQGVASTARFSFKSWGGRLDTVLRHSLSDLGFSDGDILSSIHEIQKQGNSEWVVHHLTLKNLDHAKLQDLKDDLQAAGADVEEEIRNSQPVLLVKKNGKTFQTISSDVE